jgi:hypothetical protein
MAARDTGAQATHTRGALLVAARAGAPESHRPEAERRARLRLRVALVSDEQTFVDGVGVPGGTSA